MTELASWSLVGVVGGGWWGIGGERNFLKCREVILVDAKSVCDGRTKNQKSQTDCPSPAKEKTNAPPS